jgi:HAE1 family hydrophobic/amphiphilic exporter-1
LKVALNNKLFVCGVFVAMVVVTGILVNLVPKGFMPTEDIGQIQGTTEAAQGISFDEMKVHQKQVTEKVMKVLEAKNSYLDGFMSSVGAGGPNSSSNQGRLILFLKPKNQRTMSADQVIQDLRKKVAKIPGIKLYLQLPPSIRIGGMSTKSTYQYTLSGMSGDPSELYAASNKLLEQMQKMPDLQDVNSDLQIKNLQLNVTIDRGKMATLGVTMQQVQDALNSAYSQRQLSVIYTATNQYWVILEVLPQYYRDPSMLGWLRIRASNGDLIPLSTVASVQRGAGPQQINHLGQFPSVTLSFNLRPGVALSDAVKKIETLASQTVPGDITCNFLGTAKAFQSSMQNLGALLLIAVLVIYIVLGILYESFIHPLTILSGLPSAGLGALLTLMLFGMQLDIYGFLGLVLLIGIVKKNAIMMIDFAVEYQREHNTTAEESIFKACIVRFRPIMMTTMAAILGSLPIAISFGVGASARQPLGLSIVGGLLVSQLVTLYITPVFYIYLDRFQGRLVRKRRLKSVYEGAA